MKRWFGHVFVAVAGVALVLSAGCDRGATKGEAGTDTAVGDVSKAGQTPGEGRIDRGGGETAGGSLPDSPTNYTEKGTGLPKERVER